jgi:hypothetical protein
MLLAAAFLRYIYTDALMARAGSCFTRGHYIAFLLNEVASTSFRIIRSASHPSQPQDAHTVPLCKTELLNQKGTAPARGFP